MGQSYFPTFGRVAKGPPMHERPLIQQIPYLKVVNELRLCDVPGCGKRRHGFVSRYCKYHEYRYIRTGSPTGRLLLKRDVAFEVMAARLVIEAAIERKDQGVLDALANIERLIKTAIRGGYTYKADVWGEQFLRHLWKTTGENFGWLSKEILATASGIYYRYNFYDKPISEMPTERSLHTQIGNRVIRIAPKSIMTTSRTGRKDYKRPTGFVCRGLGRSLLRTWAGDAIKRIAARVDVEMSELHRQIVAQSAEPPIEPTPGLSKSAAATLLGIWRGRVQTTIDDFKDRINEAEKAEQGERHE